MATQNTVVLDAGFPEVVVAYTEPKKDEVGIVTIPKVTTKKPPTKEHNHFTALRKVNQRVWVLFGVWAGQLYEWSFFKQAGLKAQRQVRFVATLTIGTDPHRQRGKGDCFIRFEKSGRVMRTKYTNLIPVC
jgi:hypothetical protein